MNFTDQDFPMQEDLMYDFDNFLKAFIEKGFLRNRLSKKIIRIGTCMGAITVVVTLVIGGCIQK